MVHHTPIGIRAHRHKSHYEEKALYSALPYFHRPRSHASSPPAFRHLQLTAIPIDRSIHSPDSPLQLFYRPQSIRSHASSIRPPQLAAIIIERSPLQSSRLPLLFTLAASSLPYLEYGDYLVSEKPHFFVGIVWLQLIFQWPLAALCAYGTAAGKSWFATTCLMYGASTLTSMCVHGPKCKLGSFCTTGRRLQEINVLGGLIFPVWGAITKPPAKHLSSTSSSKT